MTEARDTMLAGSDEIVSSGSENTQKATPKHENIFVRLPRQLILDMHNFKFRKSGTSYETCLVLSMILAKLTPLYAKQESEKNIRLLDFRRVWKAYGYDLVTLRKLTKRLRDINNNTLLSGYVYVDKTHISVMYNWWSSVTVYDYTVPEGFDIDIDIYKKIKLPKPKNTTNYIRVPSAIIPMVRTHTEAVDAVLYAIARNIRPHPGLAAQHRNHMSKEQLQKMIDEVVAVINREKRADALRRQNTNGDKCASVKQATQPARQAQTAQPAQPVAQPVQPAPSADIIAPPSTAQHGVTTPVGEY
jgi:hypothetical protein